MKACEINLNLEEVCAKVRPPLAKKIRYSVALIRKSEKMALRLDPENGFYNTFSGGKDSQVLYYLVKLAVFDPPHLKRIGEKNWMCKKYGKLPKNWQQLIRKGFDECMRVLDDYGTLVFKWNEDQIKLREVIEAIGKEPLFGHPTRGKTIWMVFMKIPEEQ